jgi:hypothetical protein
MTYRLGQDGGRQEGRVLALGVASGAPAGTGRVAELSSPCRAFVGTGDGT